MRLEALFLAVFMGQATWTMAQMNSQPPDMNYYLPVTNIGSNDSGTPVPFYGCTANGATLQQLSFWANNLWMRGLEATLTDGRAMQAGCLNVTGNTTGNGCSGPSLRNSSFTFQSGERITNLTIYPGYSVQGQANQRAGGLNFTTSLGRYFSFGMTQTWQNGTSINVGQGIPCGLSPKAGADIDTLGFIFLRAINVTALQSVQYSGVSSGGNGDVSLDVAPLQEGATQLTLSNQTYNNSDSSTSLVATTASQATFVSSSQWTYALGLDSYLMAPVNGSVPQVVDYSTNANVSWTLQSNGLHSRNQTNQYQEAWNYTVTIGPNGASQITASATQGNITATFGATLNTTVDSGFTFAVPVSGLYLGVSTSPVHVQVQQLAAATTQSTTSNSSHNGGGHDNTVAWVVGVLIGLICGLLLAALLAWAVVLIMRRRSRRTQDGTGDAQQGASKSRGCLPAVQIPAFFGKGKGITPEDLVKDVELGSAPGKGNWVVDEEKPNIAPAPAPAPAPAYGIPVKPSPENARTVDPQDGELPEAEGEHVLPYNMFRRLRLNSIRQNLGLESPGTTPVSAAQARLAIIEQADNLSNPPSGASTPRTIPEMLARNERASGGSSEAGAESIEGHPETGGQTARSSPAQNDIRIHHSSEDDKQSVDGETEERKHRMREQIAQRMAQRQRTPDRQLPATRSEVLPAGSNSRAKVTLMDKISNQIASYRSQGKQEARNPSGYLQRDLQGDSIRHDDEDLKLGSGYRSTENSRNLEKNTVQHDQERIRLGIRYQTQGRNE